MKLSEAATLRAIKPGRWETSTGLYQAAARPDGKVLVKGPHLLIVCRSLKAAKKQVRDHVLASLNARYGR